MCYEVIAKDPSRKKYRVGSTVKGDKIIKIVTKQLPHDSCAARSQGPM